MFLLSQLFVPLLSPNCVLTNRKIEQKLLFLACWKNKGAVNPVMRWTWHHQFYKWNCRVNMSSLPFFILIEWLHLPHASTFFFLSFLFFFAEVTLFSLSPVSKRERQTDLQPCYCDWSREQQINRKCTIDLYGELIKPLFVCLLIFINI